MIRICFVCLGNICRSPTADGVMCHLVDRAGLAGQIEIDSAGTGAWHVGEKADRRARATAESRGFRLTSRARQVTREDFDRFDYVIAMDNSNHAELLRLAPSAAMRERVFLFRSFDPESPANAEVPDPYYGGESGFEEVFDICEAACRGLLEHLRKEHELE
jgi:protein-tyrosine phosphatase